ncbi:hypothetical protein QVD17_00733 [Tagetes erecta]|uniref:Uncharacterized protein n=1 Tax=Tagetes erecta TaxID=13708 RepID=A0AAD8L8E2_TARER|nr:hypothetical protein QVD17_00733 [Tagetes erecta]
MNYHQIYPPTPPQHLYKYPSSPASPIRLHHFSLLSSIISFVSSTSLQLSCLIEMLDNRLDLAIVIDIFTIKGLDLGFLGFCEA